MSKHSKIISLLTSSSLLSLTGMGGVALAQTGPAIDYVDEIIVVGSRGRQENVVEVPLSVTVFTPQEIQDAKIDTVDDFIGLTPGVTISNSQDAGTNFITARGLSQTRNGEAPVAIIIDGVLLTNPRAFDQPLYDVESIEVLRGPQGALYGRNATNGAIIINTKGPSNEFEGYAQVSAGSGDEYAVEASVSGPIAENLRYRVSGRYLDRGGYLDNPILGEAVDYLEDISLRGHLNWDVSDTITADLRGSMVRSDGGALNFTYQPAIIDRSTGLPSAFDFTRLDANLVEEEFFANNLGNDKRDIDQISLRVKADLGFADLALTSAYDNIRQENLGDQFPYSAATSVNPAPPFPFFDGTQTQFVDVKTLSQEVRLTSQGDDALRWMVGGYYLSTDRFIASTTGQDLGQGIINTGRMPTFNASNPLSTFVADDNDNKAWALFANIDYAITDKLELAFAGRYDEDSRTQNVLSSQGAYNAGALVGPIGTPGAVNKATFNAFQPKVTARYLLSDNASLYASWGKGFRSGQFNQNGVGAAAANAGVAGVLDVLDQEDSESYELGFKSSLGGGRINFNGALYNTDVENAPYFVFIGAVGAQVLVPVEDANIKGGEVELSAELFEGLDTYLGISVSDSEVKEYSVNPATVGNRAPYVPTHTFNAGAQWRTPITESFGFFSRVDYERRGKQFWDPENSTARSDIELVNLKAGIEDLDGGWSLIGSIDNASNEIYNSEWVSGGFAHAGTPRAYRVDLRVNF